MPHYKKSFELAISLRRNIKLLPKLTVAGRPYRKTNYCISKHNLGTALKNDSAPAIRTRYSTRTIFLFTDQSVGYPLIWHLASIIKEKKATKSVPLNPQSAKKPPLTQDDRKELNFSDVRTFIRHMEVASREVYDSVMRLRKQLVLIDKQNCKLKTKLTNYEKANKSYVIDNKQLKTANHGLKTQLINLESQLANLKK